MYVTSTPLTVGITAMILKLLKRKPYIFEVRDQLPESIIELGILKNKLLIKVLLWLEKIIYKKASAVIAVSDGMADGIRQVAAKEKSIYVIPNVADLDLFSPNVDGSIIRKRQGWGDKLVFLQAGAMGRMSNAEFVVDAAQKLAGHKDILFVLVGEGFKKADLEKTVKGLGLANVEIWPSVPKEQLPPILAATDVIMVVIGNFPIIERHASLNKFYDGLSAGKPVLLNYSGWQRDMLEENQAGFGCKLCDVDEFVKKVLYLNSHRKEVLEMGQNARRAAEEKFDRDKLAAQTLLVLESTVKCLVNR
jgi:glycosyltransferase involved in cell wall biosynthesis